MLSDNGSCEDARLHSADTANSPGVAVVNQAFVKKLFKPGEDPIGQHFGVIDMKNSADFEIVGVVENTEVFER